MRMRSVLALFLALFMMMSVAAGLAQGVGNETNSAETELSIQMADRPAKTELVHLTVANATRVSGNFFTSQFGNNTSDMDVRNMIHGYSLTYWSTQETFETDHTVVKNLKVATSNGNTIYYIQLADDLVYNDGVTKITAADYVFSFLLLASDEFSRLGASTGQWSHILGYDAYAKGEILYLAGIRLIDDYNFSVTVKKDYEPFFYELSYLSVNPYPISVLAPGCMVADSPKGAFIRNIDTMEEPLYTTELLTSTVLGPEGYLRNPRLTCGPYRLEAYDAATGTVDFAINEFYKGNWEGIKPWIDTVTLVEGKINTMVRKLQDGEIGLINKAVDGDVILEAMAARTNGAMIDWSNYARLGYGYLAVACEQGAQQSQKVRQAIACCLDTDRFVADFLKGFGMTVDGYYGIGQWMYYGTMGLLTPEELSAEDTMRWEEVTLDNLDHYAYDTERAKTLLTEDGWILNEKGEAFDARQDKVRYKQGADGSLMPLSFRFARCQDNAGAQMTVDLLTPAFEEIGAELIISDVPFTEVLSDYYREDGRKYDLSFIASNFVSVFDPYLHFVKDPRFEGSMNTSGIEDEELVRLAWAMHETKPGEELEYLREWQLFQERFNEVLPTIPIYSNIYFDFYTNTLKNYHPGSEYSWPTALLYAYLDDTPQEEDMTPEEDHDRV